MTPSLAQDAYVAWMERVDQQCVNRWPECAAANVGWRYLNNEQRRRFWLGEFLDRQKEALTTWMETMGTALPSKRRLCLGKGQIWLGGGTDLLQSTSCRNTLQTLRSALTRSRVLM